MVQMMKASSESVLTLVGDAGCIESNESTSFAPVVECTRLSTPAPCDPGKTTAPRSESESAYLDFTVELDTETAN